MVLANLGCPARSRLATFGATALVGAALVAISTLAPATPLTAAITALVVVFGIDLASVFGGYVQGAVLPMLMAPVLAARRTGHPRL